MSNANFRIFKFKSENIQYSIYFKTVTHLNFKGDRTYHAFYLDHTDYMFTTNVTSITKVFIPFLQLAMHKHRLRCSIALRNGDNQSHWELQNFEPVSNSIV